MKPGLSLDNVALSVDDTQLFKISCDIPAGEITTIMGASGSGKSSLLAFIAGFLDAAFVATGSARLNGSDLTEMPAEQRKVGLLFQDALLFPHLSVGENLLFGLPAEQGQKKHERELLVRAALERVGLAGYAERDPATLSGGQQSRVALMRLLLSQPQVILLDEPFTNLDAALRDEVRTLTYSSIRAAGVPALLVTHDESDALMTGGARLSL